VTDFGRSDEVFKHLFSSRSREGSGEDATYVLASGF